MSDLESEENEVKANSDPRTKGMVIAGVAASEVTDSSGERISIEGTDISDFLNGTATLNVEHAVQGENGAFGDETVGKITYAKKIFSKDDCENEVQRKFWNQVKAPFIFILGRLYDAAGHKNAQAIAAQIRDHHANGEKINCRLSIEGLTLDRDDSGNLTSCIAKKVSITLKPCNKTCDTALVEDPQAPEGFDKEPVKLKKALPGAIGVLSSYSADLLASDIAPLEKALTAGYSGSTAPSSLTGGAALSVESSIPARKKKKVVDLVSSYAPGNDSQFATQLKSLLPEVSDEFLNHFKDIGQKIHAKNLKKLTKSEVLGLGQSILAKLENAYIELMKDEGPEATVPFAGHNVVPGLLQMPDQRYDILFEDEDWYYVVPENKAGSHQLGDMSKLPKSKETEFYRVIRHPHLPITEALGQRPLAKSVNESSHLKKSWVSVEQEPLWQELRDRNLDSKRVNEIFNTPEDVNPEVRIAAANHPNFTDIDSAVNTFKRYDDASDYYLEGLGVEFRSVGQYLKSSLRSKADQFTPDQWRNLVQYSPDAGKEILKANTSLLDDPEVQNDAIDYGIKALVASHPNATAKSLRRLTGVAETPSIAHKAAQHPNFPAESISQYLQHPSRNMNPDVVNGFFDNPNFNDEHASLLLNSPDDQTRALLAQSSHAGPHVLDRLLKDQNQLVRQYAVSNANLTPQQAASVARDKETSGPVLAQLARDQKQKLDASDLDAIYHHAKGEAAGEYVAKNPSASPQLLSEIVKHYREHSDKAVPARNYRQALSNPNMPPKLLEEGLKSATEREQYNYLGQIYRNPSLTSEAITRHLQDIPQHDSYWGESAVFEDLLNHPNAKPEHLGQALRRAPTFLAAIEHPSLTAKQISDAYQENEENPATWFNKGKVAKHSATPVDVLKDIFYDPNGYDTDKEHAQKALAKLSPDSTHNEHVEVGLNTGKLRKIRDLMEEKGVKEIHPSKLPPGDFSRIRGPNGNVSLQSIQEAIDKTPKQRWNISHADWYGVQRHSNEPSRVLQVNLSDHHLNALRQAGAYPEFKKLADASAEAEHPVTPTTIGWVRYTGNPNTGFHIDEIQSDFGQDFHKQIAGQARAQAEKEAKEQGLEGEQASKFITKRQGEMVAEGHKYLPDSKHGIISNILFQNRPANEVLFEAFRQHMRDKGYHNTPIHINSPQLKAPLSQLDEDKPIPGHFHTTYEKIPKQAGMEPAKYGDIPTQSNPDLKGQKTFQDKVRKSLKESKA